MTALRTTRSVPPPLWYAAALLALVGLAGCGGAPPDADAARPKMRQLPPPAAERIQYNPDTRTLSLYRLPASGRWMVQDADGSEAVAVGPTHVLADTADPEAARVSYRRPTGQASGSVSVGDIMAARLSHTSN